MTRRATNDVRIAHGYLLVNAAIVRQTVNGSIRQALA